MKTVNLPSLLVLLAMLLISGCGSNGKSGQETISTDIVNNPNTANGDAGQGSLPIIDFEKTEHDFGRIIEGETVAFSFNFTNSGKSDLILAEVTTSCGCTVPSYSKTPIRPGESGTIKVAFNSTGRRGYQNKDIVVVSNTQPNSSVLRIKAQVVNPAAEK